MQPFRHILRQHFLFRLALQRIQLPGAVGRGNAGEHHGFGHHQAVGGRYDARPVRHAFRRNLWLTAFSVLHAYLLLSAHDVLYVYGLPGLALFPLRRVHPLQLSALGVALLSAGALINAYGTRF